MLEQQTRLARQQTWSPWGGGGGWVHAGPSRSIPIAEPCRTYDFTHPGRYGAASDRHGNRLAGKVVRGRYTLKGNLIIPTSGPLEQAHDYMRLNRPTVLVVFKNNGKATGIGCYYHKP